MLPSGATCPRAHFLELVRRIPWGVKSKTQASAEQEWQYLLVEDGELRLQRAKKFRQSERIEP
mgnify:CR=1 FL=1